MLQKNTEDMSKAELEMQEVFELIREIKCDLQEIKTIANNALIKASMSHSLIVVRKISEDKLEQLNKILD